MCGEERRLRNWNTENRIQNSEVAEFGAMEFSVRIAGKKPDLLNSPIAALSEF
jgi:hypothetical protein